MDMRKRLSQSRGFSLVELMVVVAIISILAAIAIPKFRTFQAKARQSEAKMTLANVYTLEVSYQAENDTFLALASPGPCNGAASVSNALGFLISDCTKSRYIYSIVAPGAPATTFTATAQSPGPTGAAVVPGCATRDTWTINESKILTNTVNAVATCN